MTNVRCTQTFETLADIHQLPCISEVTERIRDRFGLKSVAYLGTGLDARKHSEPYLAVTYRNDWVEHYKRQRYIEIDPIIQEGFRRLLPLDWDELDISKAALKNFFGEASEFGLGRHGLTVPIRGRGQDRALFSITSDLTKREWTQEKLVLMREFQVIAMHVHDRVLRLEGYEPPQIGLSPRELECLLWTAEGKTAWECAVILGLSQNTVRCYLESARHKLNATSNTHAVSIAHRLGMLVDPL